MSSSPLPATAPRIWLHLEADTADRQLQRVPDGLLLTLGSADLRQRFFPALPPRAADLETAIMLVEDQLAVWRSALPSNAIWLAANPLAQATLRLVANGQHVTRQAVEHCYARLEASTQGLPWSQSGLPDDPARISALLWLRELMHHLDVAVVQLPDADIAPMSDKPV